MGPRALAVSLSLALMACSSASVGTRPLDGASASDGGASDGDGTANARRDLYGNGEFGTAARDGASCPSQVLCGAAGLCCPVGEECVAGVCRSACASGVRCAADCCSVGQLCLVQQCTDPGIACKDSFDCPEGQFCEPIVGSCLPQPPSAELCQIRPPTPRFDPIVEWSWTSSAIKSDYLQVINMPVVIDLDKDGIPEVVIVTSVGYEATGVAYLRALDGRTGKEKWPATSDVYKDAYAVNPRGTPAAADLDGDGSVEIVAPKSGGGVIAFNADGSFRWRSMRQDGSTTYDGSLNSATIALADLDNDGKGEVVVAGVILDHRGRLVDDVSIGREKWGANDPGYGPVSIIADVDGDPKTSALHVVTGNRALRKDGSLLWDISASLADGYAAVTDFDQDGIPELVVVGRDSKAAGELRVQRATTGALLARISMPGSGRGGPPIIADFDGDGQMEIASANGSKYNVFEYDSVAKKLTVKWSKDTQDLSSNVTGSSVFDFEGDGAAEVIYNDECYARVYDGRSGDVLFEVQNSSATIHEYPVLVDVDGDNNTEFVVVANDANHKTGNPSCSSPAGAYTARAGVFVYGDRHDRWVRTRRIWNQHAYHITNVAADGALPRVENSSWGSSGDRTYRVSSQGAGVFNAPDLGVDLEISTTACPFALLLRARVTNKGALGVQAGIAVEFYRGQSATGSFLGQKPTAGSLLPGQSEVVEWRFPILDEQPPFDFFVRVDGGAEQSLSVVLECDESNNVASAGGVRCWSID